MNNIQNNDLLTLARMVNLVHNTKSQSVKEWALKQGRNALIAWSTLRNDI